MAQKIGFGGTRLTSNSVPLPKISLDSKTLSDRDRSLKTEWLITNGLGGYASSTVLGLNTRKYHSLLIAALNPPVRRHVFLTKLDEGISIGNRTFFLGANEDTRGLQLEGARFITDFSLAPFPTFTYGVNGQFQLKKTVFMPHMRNATVILYEVFNASPRSMGVSISPLVNFRYFHWVTSRGQIRWRIDQKDLDRRVTIGSETDSSALILQCMEGRFMGGQGEWIESHLRAEAQRGESSLDYSLKPGFFQLEIEPDQTKRFSVLAVAGKDQNEVENVLSSIYVDSASVDKLYKDALGRSSALLRDFTGRYASIQFDDWLKWLVLAADSFIVNRESTRTKSVIAGYHWFADWGRDSLISLPGLTLTTGRFEDAKEILLTFQHYCREGLVPNNFPDRAGQSPSYNTVDATLWYFNAVLQFLKYTNEFEFVKEKLWTTLQSIIDNHVSGTMFDIRVDADGLIAHGPQLTWMDAAPGNVPVTPRVGKAVEIQALWYNALKIMQLLANRFGQESEAETYLGMAEKAKKSFLEKFWNQQGNCLFDVVGLDGGRDGSLRPNQVIAGSLDFTMLGDLLTEKAVGTAQEKLLTPFGLRTLASNDSRYAGTYEGDRWRRDKAYHNGTVWPWLLGPFVTAFLKVKNHDSRWCSYAFDNFLKPLFTEELRRGGLGSISEVADGEPPHKPGGCIAQAWSVAEPFRAYVEDVLFYRPAYEKKVLES